MPAVSARRAWRQSAMALIVGGAAWAAPLLLVLATLGSGHVLWEIGAFFSRLALVSFGGAYAALAYLAQAAVAGFGWMRPAEMVRSEERRGGQEGGSTGES